MTTTGSGPYDAIVVGGGHNGLIAAAYLGRAGLRTLLLERRLRAGGPLETVELVPGVRVPRGVHHVGRLRQSVVRDLDLVAHGLRLVQPRARVLALRPDDDALTLWGDPQLTAAELARRGGDGEADAAAWLAFDARLRRLAPMVARIARATPPDLGEAGIAEGLAGLRAGLRLRAEDREDVRALMRWLPMAVSDLVSDHFRSEAVRAAIAARGVASTGMSVRAPGTTAQLLADAAGADPGGAGHAVFVRGGPGALADALLASARAAGVEVRTGAEVGRILERDDRAAGVALSTGEEIAARIVVSGLDVKRTLLDLVDPAWLGPRLSWRTGNLRSEGTTAKVNLALAALPRFAGVDGDTDRLRGRILVAPSLRSLELAHRAAKYGDLPDEPWLEATLPSLIDPSLVDADRTPGAHVLSVHAQWVPRRLANGEEPDREAIGERVLDVLERVAPGVRASVTGMEVLRPGDIEREYGVTGGHPSHLEPALDQVFAWRPLLGFARYRMPLPGLYLASASAHPGGWITGGPGQHAARAVLEDRRRTG